MSYEEGVVNYFFAAFTNPVMFVSMYIYGGAIIGSLKWFFFALTTLSGTLSIDQLISMVVSQLIPPLTLFGIITTCS